jgi:hypothetical protein
MHLPSPASIIFALFPALSAGCLPLGSSEISPEDLFERVSPSVAKVYGLSNTLENNRSGTAFSTTINQVRVLVTNKHVVERASVLVVETGDGIWVSPAWREHPQLDIAVIDMPEGSRIPPIEISTASTLRPGRRVFSIGYPLGESVTIQEGIVSTVNGTELVYSAPLSTGASGSPLLTGEGKVVGLCHSYIPDAQNYNLAIPADFLLLEENWSKRKSSPDPSLKKYLDKIVKAKSVTLKMRREWAGLGQDFPGWAEWIKRTDMTRAPLLQAIEDMQLAVHSVEWGNVGSPLHRDADLLSAAMIKRNASVVEAAWELHSKNIRHCASHIPPNEAQPFLPANDVVLRLARTAKELADGIEKSSDQEAGAPHPTDPFAINPPRYDLRGKNLAHVLQDHLQAESDWRVSLAP